MEEYVTHAECESHRDEIERRLLESALKITELETSLQSLVSTNKMILTSVISGMITIITILLTRGI